MKRAFQRFLCFALFLGSFVSCTEDVNFSQFNDLQATPTFEAGVFYLEATESIINLVTGANVFSQNFNFEAFSSDIFAERVLDGTITYVVENTTSKQLDITVELVDIDGNVTDTEFFSIQPAPTPILQREIAYGDSGRSIDIIKTLATIRVTAQNLGDNTSVSDLPNPLITLKSSGKFRVRVK